MQKKNLARTIMVALTLAVAVFAVTVPAAYSNITIPSFETPSLTVPSITAPVVTAPVVVAPVVTTPEVTAPVVTAPTITVPEVPTTPTVTIPTVIPPTVIPPTITPPTVTPPTTSGSYAFCKIKADRTSVASGESVTVTWETNGFAIIKVNGEVVSGNTGSKTFTNITTNTIFKLEAVSADGNSVCKAQVSVACIPPVVVNPICTLDASKNLITKGEQVTLTWTTDNATNVSIDRGIGNVSLDGNTSVAPTETTTYTLTAAKDGKHVQCPVTITVKDTPEEPKAKIYAKKIVCDNEASLPNWGNGGPDITLNTASDWVANNPGCRLESGWKFQWAPASAVNPGDTLTGEAGAPWTTFGPTGSNGVAMIELKASEVGSKIWLREVLQSGYIPFTYGQNNKINSANVSAEFYCNTDVLNYDNFDNISGLAAGKSYVCVAWNVKEKTETPAPKCDDFTATPNSFNNGTGGNVTLAWNTTNASAVSIDNGVGAVEADGSKVVNVATNTTFILTATGNGKTVSCPATVTITKPETPVFRCDSFSASPNSLRRGERTTLTWETTGASEATINNGVGTVALDGNTSVVVNDDTQYTLVAKDAQGNTVSCDANVSITSGGGGGSSSPRCDLNISDTKVKAGEKVTISWKNSRVNEMILKDNRGSVLVDTEDDSNYDEDNGEIVVRPTRDTEYTMTVSRGSKDRVCRVKVDVSDEVTVTETRTRTPQVAGISLTQVPYTGFEAGPFMTLLFYTILGAWAAFVAYLLVVREKTVLGFSLAAAPVAVAYQNEEAPVVEAEPEVVASSVVASAATIPANLPTMELNSKSGNPIFGYQSFMTVADDVEIEEDAVEEDTDMAALETAAHNASTLLSSDAIAYFMNAYDDEAARLAALATVIARAKAQYPSEGGWLVLNRQRVDALSTEVVAEDISFAPQPIVGASSLAEAIATGNVTAAYELIGNRPMFALADAAADFDGVVRVRKGMEANPSQLLLDSTVSLSDAQVEAIVAALTGALDGAYNDEAHAVKMAIMKAIRVVG